MYQKTVQLYNNLPNEHRELWVNLEMQDRRGREGHLESQVAGEQVGSLVRWEILAQLDQRDREDQPYVVFSFTCTTRNIIYEHTTPFSCTYTLPLPFAITNKEVFSVYRVLRERLAMQETLVHQVPLVSGDRRACRDRLVSSDHRFKLFLCVL